jgi:hypothetical protein
MAVSCFPARDPTIHGLLLLVREYRASDLPGLFLLSRKDSRNMIPVATPSNQKVSMQGMPVIIGYVKGMPGWP